MTRVGFFLANFYGGGAERIMLSYVNNLPQDVFKVFLLVGDDSGPLRDLVDPSVSKIILGVKRSIFSPIPLRREIMLNGIQILISTLTHVNVAALIATRFLKGVKVYIREAGTPSKALDQNGQWFLKALAKFLFPFADGVIAVSQAVKRDILLFYGIAEDRITVIYNGIDVPRESRHVSHRFYQKGSVIIAVGRIASVKDYSTLLFAFAKIASRKNYYLLILGERESEGEWKKIWEIRQALELENRVDFLGFVNNPMDYILRADVLVSSSIHEGLPNVLLQAMACGRNVVSTASSGGVSEILADGKFGIIVPVGDHEALANALDQQIVNPLQTEEVLQNRAKYFSSARTIEKLVSLLNSGK